MNFDLHTFQFLFIAVWVLPFQHNSLTVGVKSMSGTGHSPKVRKILELSLGLAEGVVLSGQLKLSHLEGKLRMDVGGLTRQCLRLGI